MNNMIATGHIMRCLSIADAATILGESTTFLLADEQGAELVKERGHHFIVLHTKWDHMEAELPALCKVIKECHITRILIDSYQVTEKYLEQLKTYVEIYYIDDVNAFHYPTDAIICYENYWKKFQYQDNYKDVSLYLGMKYIPLRKVYMNCTQKCIKPHIEKILLLSGGTDPYNILDSLLEQMDRGNYKQIAVICGRYYDKYEVLCNKYADEKNIRIRQGVSDIEQYMLDADFAVSAGGTTLYELCAVGTPTVSYSFVDNQLDNVIKFDQDHLIDYAGDLRKDDVAGCIIEFLKSYHYNKNLRKERSRKMQKLVDGKGALRIAKLMIEK